MFQQWTRRVASCSSVSICYSATGADALLRCVRLRDRVGSALSGIPPAVFITTWTFLKPPLQKNGSFTQWRCPSDCLFVRLSAALVAELKHQGCQLFSLPWETSPCEIYTSGGGLLIVPINVPQSFSISSVVEMMECHWSDLILVQFLLGPMWTVCSKKTSLIACVTLGKITNLNEYFR